MQRRNQMTSHHAAQTQLAALGPTVFAAAMALACGNAQAAIACMGASATSLSGTTPVSGNLDLSGGNIAVTCTRAPGDPITQTIYIGINAGENPDGTAGREMTRQTGAQQMNYAIYRNATPSGGWSMGNGRTPGSGGGGGLQVGVTFSSAATTTQVFNFPYYLRVTNANYSGGARPAGIYDDLLLLATVRLNSRTGPDQATAGFGVTVSKPSHCYISTAPAALLLNYVAFSPSAAVGTTSFGVSCTASTGYTMALNSRNGVVLGLQYTLALSATGASGTGFAQTHNVNAVIPAGQAGNCPTGSCTGSSAHSVIITY